MNTDWYVLYSNIRCEQKAYDGLIKQGFDAYLPIRVEERKHRRSRQVREIKLPLFTRYLFVRQFPLEDHLSWFMIRKTDGIEAALYNNGTPATVAGSVIADLRQAQEGGAFDQRIPNPSAFRQGQAVKIVDGPFGGHMATIQSVLPGSSAKVLMKLFGSTRCARVPIDALRLVA